MEYEYDSRKNRASQMKRKHNFFSAAHFAIPLPTVTCNLSPVTWNHTFSAKEKDTETGLSYFGSRYYSSDLSIWLSVDPMSDKYPSFSPYVYCANNPIKIVDPNGEEIGDYFDAYGKYLGTDGKVDRNIYIVTDSESQRYIKKNERKHSTTESSKVNITLSTDIDVLQETCNVYQRTENNGGNMEEASTFDNDGNLKQYPTA